jgi:hypothetical protein
MMEEADVSYILSATTCFCIHCTSGRENVLKQHYFNVLIFIPYNSDV